MSKARGDSQEEKPHVQAAVAAQAQEGLEELSHVEGQKGSDEEIHFVQGKEQQLHSAGTAMKRYSTPKVRETQDCRCYKRASEGRHTENIFTEN